MAKHQPDGPLSRSVEDYLKAVYAIEAETGTATTGAVAERLNLAPASVTNMLQRLATLKRPLLSYEKHRGATLTERGRRRALEMVRHHRLIELFLHRVLGYRWDEVHDEAERLEHAISEDLEERIAERLGHPVADPHGEPIPAKDGTMPALQDVPLAEIQHGNRAVVSRVRDDDPSMLRYLEGLGLMPGARLSVVDRGPFDGPFIVRVGDGGDLALSRRVAARVRVLVDERGGETPER